MNSVVFIFGSILLLALFVLSLFGMDFVVYDRDKDTNLKNHKLMKGVARFNGPIVVLLCIAGIAWSPFIVTAPEGGVLLAIVTFIDSVMCL